MFTRELVNREYIVWMLHLNIKDMSQLLSNSVVGRSKETLLKKCSLRCCRQQKRVTAVIVREYRADVLTDSEALELLYMPKLTADHDVRYITQRFEVDLVSHDKKEIFTFDFSNSTKNMTLKYKNQIRCKKDIPLLRLDVGSSWHENPKKHVACDPKDPFYTVHDSCVGKMFEVGEPHIHYFREGYGDAWAYPVPPEFDDLDDVKKTVNQFLDKCNVVDKPIIQRGL